MDLGAALRHKLKRNNGPGIEQPAKEAIEYEWREKNECMANCPVRDLNYGDEAPYAIHIIKHDAVFVQM